MSLLATLFKAFPSVQDSSGIAKGKNNADAFRYERKFVVRCLNLKNIESLVRMHPSRFSHIYIPRYINNIYFDTPRLKHFSSSADGISKRMKFRIRWYGDLATRVDHPQLEIKEKTGSVCRKHIFSLCGFEFRNNHTVSEFCDIFHESDLPVEIINSLKYLKPLLVNRYRRVYYRSHDERFRLTLDSDLMYWGTRAYGNPFLRQTVEEAKIILEIKYHIRHDSDFPGISNHFPFRVSKNSKYISGMDKVYRCNNRSLFY